MNSQVTFNPLGDVNHWVNPLIGWLRLMKADGEDLPSGESDQIVRGLRTALYAVDGYSFVRQAAFKNNNIEVGTAPPDNEPASFRSDVYYWLTPLFSVLDSAPVTCEDLDLLISSMRAAVSAANGDSRQDQIKTSLLPA